MTESAVPALDSSGPGAFSVTGPVTFDTVAALLEEGRSRFAGQATVTVNLEGVSKVDSAGLALLLEWLRQARTDRRQLTFTGLPDKLLAIAKLSGVEEFLGDSYSSAPGSVASSSGS